MLATSAACVRVTSSAPTKIWAWKSSAPATSSPTTTTTTARSQMGDATLLYDDVTGFETGRVRQAPQADMVGSGIKEKYIFQKMGIPPARCTPGTTWSVPRLRRFRHLRP